MRTPEFRVIDLPTKGDSPLAEDKELPEMAIEILDEDLNGVLFTFGDVTIQEDGRCKCEYNILWYPDDLAPKSTMLEVIDKRVMKIMEVVVEEVMTLEDEDDADID